MNSTTNALPDTTEVEYFRDRIATLLGICFDDSKLVGMANLMQRRTQLHGMNPRTYMAWIGTIPGYDELQALAVELTVTETYFMRNCEQFNAFADVAMRLSAAASSDHPSLSVLSARCASGEEPYSLAIMLREVNPQLAQNTGITAFDINSAMLNKAKKAVYSRWSLRDVAPEIKARWFKADGADYRLVEPIKAAVQFELRNLITESREFWWPERFDIVFCRNALMYFNVEQAQVAVARIARSIKPGGYLFLGHAETLRGISSDFHIVHTHGAFYYQRKPHLSAPHFDISTSDHMHTAILGGRPRTITNDVGWVEVIQQATRRIEALAPPVLEEQSENIDRYPQLNHSQLNHSQLSGETNYTPDPDVLLFKAVSQSHQGDLSGAEAICKQLLAYDAMNAGAYYVTALCRESVEDLDSALENDQTATYIDRQFAMPRLHMGLIYRRRGMLREARGHLNQALQLLQQEDAARILLFGGGFQRESLVALCRAELDALNEESVGDIR